MKLFSSMKNISYFPVDLYPNNPKIKKMDITHIDLPNNSIDIVICSHVLEHVIEDYKAIGEIFRILKPDGKAIFLVPVYYNQEITFEDFSITSPEERLKYFDQSDHVRRYGRDFPGRLEKAGFKVSKFLLQDIEKKDRIKYGLDGYDNDFRVNAMRGADIFFCKKQ